jgi:hypothetical protein
LRAAATLKINYFSFNVELISKLQLSKNDYSRLVTGSGKACFKTRYKYVPVRSTAASLPPTVLKHAFPKPVTSLLWSFLLNCNFEISSSIFVKSAAQAKQGKNDCLNPTIRIETI